MESSPANKRPLAHPLGWRPGDRLPHTGSEPNGLAHTLCTLEWHTCLIPTALHDSAYLKGYTPCLRRQLCIAITDAWQFISPL